MLVEDKKQSRHLTPKIMGILNITEDSFSDGMSYLQADKAVIHFKKMIAEGADIIDIGAESSRPGAKEIDVNLELERITALMELLPDNEDVEISVDTSRTKTAAKAISLGAKIINDIYALKRDPQLADLISEKKCKVVLMHMLGTPDNMQHNPNYDNVIDELLSFFEERITYATNRGIQEENIILDPGIGFGKRSADNLTIIKNISHFKKLGFPVLVGHSRKTFIGDIIGLNPKERDFGTGAVTAYLSLQNIDILRVHNVKAMKDIVVVLDSILNSDKRCA